MKALKTDTSNVKLSLEGANDLHAEKITLPVPGADPEDPEAKRENGYETVWELEEGERRAVLNGAPVLLHVWGDGHPAVNLVCGEPTAGRDRLYTEFHVNLAMGLFLEEFSEWAASNAERMEAAGREEEGAGEVLRIWARCLEKTSIHDRIMDAWKTAGRAEDGVRVIQAALEAGVHPPMPAESSAAESNGNGQPT